MYIRCHNWEDLKRLVDSPEIVLYELNPSEKLFHIYAINFGKVQQIYFYDEPLWFKATEKIKIKKGEVPVVETRINSLDKPESAKFSIVGTNPMKKKLNCGLSYKVVAKLLKEEKKWIVEINYQLNHDEVRNFISREMNVPTNKVAEGAIAELK